MKFFTHVFRIFFFIKPQGSKKSRKKKNSDHVIFYEWCILMKTRMVTDTHTPRVTSTTFYILIAIRRCPLKVALQRKSKSHKLSWRVSQIWSISRKNDM